MKKAVLFSLIALVGGTAFGAAAGSIAWFADKATLDENDNLTGSALGAYFAYGDGSSEANAYGIKKPRHLYNLAWLQYLGYFGDSQPYFIVDQNIDMQGMVLPPIGTADNPFIGHFDGNKKVISNFTTSNVISDFGSKKPVGVNSLSDVEIVGFFGVVGNYDGKYESLSEVPSVQDIGLADFSVNAKTTKALAGLGAGYVNGVVSGVAVDDGTLDIEASQALGNPFTNISNYGLVGFAEPNYRASTNVVDITAYKPVVENGASASPNNLYGASIPMKTIYERLLGLEQNAHNNDNRLSYVDGIDVYFKQDGTFDYQQNRPVTKNNVSSSDKIVMNQETDSSGDQIGSYSFYDRGEGYEAYMYLYGEKTVNYTETTYNHEYYQIPDFDAAGGFAIYYDDGSTTHYLNASTSATSDYTGNLAGATKWHYANNHLYTTINNTRYYLYFNSATSLQMTTATNVTNLRTLWAYSPQAKTFINFYNGTASGLTYTTAWRAPSNGLSAKIVIGNTSKNQWMYLNSGTYSSNGSQFTTKTESTTATEWAVNSSGYLTGQFEGKSYTMGQNSQNSQTLGAFTTNKNPMVLKNEANGPYLHFTYSSGGWWGSTYDFYVAYSSGWKSVTTKTNLELMASATVAQGTDYSISASATKTVRDAVTSTSSVAKTATTNPTYFPLAYTANAQGKNQGQDIAVTNTGYVVSGSNYQSQPGDIRVSRYPLYQSHSDYYFRRYNLGNSFAGNATSTSYPNQDGSSIAFDILTRDSSGNYVRIKDDYNKDSNATNTRLTQAKYWYGKKDPSNPEATTLGLKRYKSAREGLHASLKGQSNVYGLHFMDSQISASRKVSVDKAIVNGKLYKDNKEYQLDLRKNGKEYAKDSYGNYLYDIGTSVDVGGKYEFPQDCIDFNLSKYGTINFFAGSYFPDNTTFFSLHQIFRDGTGTNKVAITDIKEIREVWENTKYDPLAENPGNKYIYGFGTKAGITSWSETKTANHVKVFDLSWITDQANISSLSVDSTNGSRGNYHESYGTCFYFEIPLNAGEYALGSVEGYDGAYLMYLDIGAADADTDKTIITELKVTNTNSFDHPKGIDFAAFVVTDEVYAYAAVTGNDSATVVIPVGVTGKINFKYEAKTLTCGPPTSQDSLSGSITRCSYIGDGVTVNFKPTYSGSPSKLTATPTSNTNVRLERETVYTYDVDNEMLKTVISEGVNGGDLEVVSAPDPVKVLEADYDLQRLAVYEDEETLGETDYLTLKYYITQPTVTVTHIFTYDNDSESATYHHYLYQWTVASTGETIKVYVTKTIDEDGFEVVVNETIVTGTQTITVTKSS